MPSKRNNSDKISHTDPVGSIGNANLGVFAIAGIATKDAGSVAPTDLVTRMPNPAVAKVLPADYAADSPYAAHPLVVVVYRTSFISFQVGFSSCGAMTA